MDDTPRYSLAELAKLGDVSRRTIRYYIQRELLPSPTGLGRGKHYTEEHLQTLIHIRQWQEQGDSLATIARRLQNLPDDEPEIHTRSEPQPTATPPPRPQPSSSPHPPQPGAYGVWLRLPLDSGTELHVRADQLPQLGDLGALAQHLRDVLARWKR